MRKLTAILLLVTWKLATGDLCYANNIRVENVQLYKSSDQPTGTIDIKFDVIWDNSVSGTDDNDEAFFDRAWIFVKYGTGSPTVWTHAKIIPGGSVTAYSSSTNTGTTTDGIGAFVSPGVGQTIRWNYGTTTYYSIAGNQLAGTETVKVRVMGIEMVYIPQGSFYVGDGTTTSVKGQFCIGTTTTSPFNITGEGELTLGGGGSNLGNNNGSGMATADDFNDSTTKTLPAAFPKGYNAFYCMKYEISQGQYRDFLNMLTRAQQNVRTYATVTTDAITNVYVMANTSTVSYRQGIRCPASGNGTTDPITFGCDLDADGTFDESSDGEWIACNYVSWMDIAAFADWAGLRPFTELEYEKACRGGSATDNTVAGEYAWGTAYVAGSAYTLSNSGAINEDIATNYSTTADYGNCINSTTDGSIGGPLRSGIFAGNSANTTRVTAGASYYGVMELSGNLYERSVTIGNTTSGTVIGGRAFEGTHGDGTLTTLTSYEGNATNSDWPGYRTDYSTRGVYGGAGSGRRGGPWNDSFSYARVSDRYVAAYLSTDRIYYNGGRCARTSP